MTNLLKIGRRVAFPLLFALNSLTPVTYGQSLPETVTWIKDFIALKDGTEKETFIDDELMTQQNKTFWPYKTMKKVEIWSVPGKKNSDFVRILGTIYDCTAVDEFNGLTHIMQVCPSHTETMDLKLKSDLDNNQENCLRLKKAIIHLIELNGGKVNTPDPF